MATLLFAMGEEETADPSRPVLSRPAKRDGTEDECRRPNATDCSKRARSTAPGRQEDERVLAAALGERIGALAARSTGAEERPFPLSSALPGGLLLSGGRAQLRRRAPHGSGVP